MKNYINKQDIIQKIYNQAFIAILRDNDYQACVDRANAIIEGGVELLEISITTPDAFKAINKLATVENKNYVIGAGTILTVDQAKLAVESGAEFLIAPSFDKEVAVYCNEIDMCYIAGVGTMTEIVVAMNHGVQLQKLFPANCYGTSFVKMAKAPLPMAKLIPTGGITLNQVEDYFKAGSYAVAIGTELTHPSKDKFDYQEVKENAKRVVGYINSIKQLRI